MGDTGEDYKFMRELNKKRKQDNLKKADKKGWKIHTEYHWSMMMNGERVDYYPSKNKWIINNKTMHGDVKKYIARRLNNG